MLNQPINLLVRRNEARIIRDQLRDHLSALKNWLVTAVETKNETRAMELVAEIRAVQDAFASVNGALMKVEKEA